MYYTIYKTTNKLNNKIYIGKHQTNDLNDNYTGSGKHLKYAINKYGAENFVKEILFIFDNEQEMNQKEKELVTKDFCKRNDTYNICEGGKGGWGYLNDGSKKHIDRVKKAGIKGNKISQKVRKKKYGSCISPNAKIASAKALKLKALENPDSFKTFKDKSHTEKTKRIIGLKNSYNQLGKRNSQYDTCWINNSKENKKIDKNDLDIWLKKGYNKGRKMKL